MLDKSILDTFGTAISTLRLKSHAYACLLLCIFTIVEAQAQSDPCDYSCIAQVHLSLDENCEATIFPSTVGATTSSTDPDFSIIVFDNNNIPISGNTVGLSNVNQNLNYEVTSSCGVRCEGKILIEYKLAPLISCPPNLTIACGGLDILSLPPASGRCGGGDFEVFLLDEQRNTLTCDPLYTGIVTRTYRARNSFGNFVDCTHTIHLERVDLNGVQFPDNANISCSDPNYIFNAEGFPLPWISNTVLTGSGSGFVPTGSGSFGVPIVCNTGNAGIFFPVCGSGSSAFPFIPNGGATIVTPDGVELQPSNANVLCNSVILYTDLEIPSTPCNKKIMRTWEIREWWCSGESSRMNVQLIEVTDDQAPTFTCPNNFTVSSDEDCEMNVTLPSVTATDACNNGTKVQIQSPNVLLNTNGGEAMLDAGDNMVTYIVSDDCYNQSSCQIVVTVEDNVEPVAICEQRMVVSLNNATSTYVFADALDDGSWDGCGLDRFEIRRMATDCDPDDLMFGDRIALCCSDADSEIMVVFRAIDKSGNFNDCMVIVEVQNKLQTSLSCPPNQTIDCRDPYDPNNLSATFGEAKVIGDCTNPHTVMESDDNGINQCGLGEIERTFRLVDSNTNAIVATCKQLITINNNTPFVASNIDWPESISITSNVCSTSEVDPEDLDPLNAFPIFTGGDDECSLLGFNYDDNLIATTNTSQCFRIERTWTVINWCDQASGSFAQFTDPRGPQIIEVSNANSLTFNPPADVTAEFQGASCINGMVTTSVNGSSQCGNVNWSYDLFDQGNNSMGISGTSSTFNHDLVAGNYIIRWTATDGCNNSITHNQNLAVISTKIPTPVCINNMMVQLTNEIDTDGDNINDDMELELWASDFDGGSFHSCNNPISISFDPNTIETNIVFNCGDVGTQVVRLYVTDMVTMAQDFCSAFITIQAGALCSTSPNMVTVEGNIFTEELESVEEVKVSLQSTPMSDMTDAAGNYAFPAMPMGGSYLISPDKNNDYLNGVSTLDIILIQRHILGTHGLESPYKLIAADIDNNEKISAVDLIELRKLILGITDDFGNNSSWRFVDADHQFIDESNPWINVWPEDYTIYNLESDMTIDFVGVKVGDVNASAIANLDSKILDQRSSRWPLVFNINSTNIEANEYVEIPVTAKNYERVSGWQMALSFDTDKIEVVGIKSEELNVSEENYLINNQDKGLISISFNHLKEKDIENDEILFKIIAITKEAVNTSNLFTKDSNRLVSEAYRGLNEVVNLELSTSNQSDVLKIVSAKPNPWKAFTNLEIMSPQSEQASLEIYNYNGQLIGQKNLSLVKGAQTINLDRSEFGTQGIYYVKLKSGKYQADYKLVLLD